MTVLTATKWPTNGHMIADVAKFGYLDGSVLDTTYGYGVFWSQWKPDDLTACDLNPDKSPVGYSVDVRKLPWDKGSFDTVVFDGPYKLNGKPSDPDERYGVDTPATWQERMELLILGVAKCCYVARKYVLCKCMDQVVSGKKRWQTHVLTESARELGRMRLVDKFDMLTDPRPQPPGRRQVHTQGNYSTLLVFGRD